MCQTRLISLTSQDSEDSVEISTPAGTRACPPWLLGTSRTYCELSALLPTLPVLPWQLFSFLFPPPHSVFEFSALASLSLHASLPQALPVVSLLPGAHSSLPSQPPPPCPLLIPQASLETAPLAGSSPGAGQCPAFMPTLIRAFMASHC